MRVATLTILGWLALGLVAVGCAGSSEPDLATFTRDWGDGRVETLQLFSDGRVLMNHVGYIDRTTLQADDVQRLAAALADIRPADDPSAYPRLTLTPTGGASVVVATDPGTVGELFLSLLDTHRLP
jgi:hypothetical protein